MSNIELKILERRGKFMVGRMVKEKKYFWSKPTEEFKPIWKEPFVPAHFETLHEARAFVKKISKPDIYHEV